MAWNLATSDGPRADTEVLGEGGYKKWEKCLYTSGSISIDVAAGVTSLIETVGDFTRFFEEVKIYRSLNHPGIVRAYGGFIRDDNRGVFITELASGDLHVYVKNQMDPGMSVKF